MLIHKSLAAGLVLIFLLAAFALVSPKDPKSLVAQMVDTVGGTDRLYQLRDVEYTYIVRDARTGKQDVSLERYIFDGELSWARYSERQKSALPDLPGELIQGFDGQTSWATLNGEPLREKQALRRVDFSRKTNYYWFVMMYKLLDPGINYDHKGARSVDGISYDLVEITFDKGVGDVQDTYLLYINPKTKLVDCFLFTVMDFNVTTPMLMLVEYETIDGLTLPVTRKFTRSNWQGEIVGDVWTEELMRDIKFNNSLARELFSPPAAN